MPGVKVVFDKLESLFWTCTVCSIHKTSTSVSLFSGSEVMCSEVVENRDNMNQHSSTGVSSPPKAIMAMPCFPFCCLSYILDVQVHTLYMPIPSNSI